VQLKLSDRGNEKTQPGGWVFSEQTARSSGYPAKMWGSGRRARDVMPVAWRAALVSCWKSVAFIVSHGGMGAAPVQALGAAAAYGVPAASASAPTHGVIETRIFSRLPGSSGSRERYLVPL